MQLHFSLPLLSLSFHALSFPYRKWKMYQIEKKSDWNAKDSLANFIYLSQAKPEELPLRICPKQYFNILPLLRGRLSASNNISAFLAKIAECTSAFFGISIPAIHIAKRFSSCLSNAPFGTCSKEMIDALFSLSGIQLLIQAFLISQIVKHLWIQPILEIVAGDPFVEHRTKLLSKEYRNMLLALSEVLDQPRDDPKLMAVVSVAKKFLSLSPQIVKEMENSLALNIEQAKELILPLQIACRQILAKSIHQLPLAQGYVRVFSHNDVIRQFNSNNSSRFS